MDSEAQATAHADYNQWPVVDETGDVVAWSSMAAALLDEITAEENPAEGNSDVAGEWQEALMVELWGLKTYFGRRWMCYAFIPVLMYILKSSNILGVAAVDEKVMPVNNVEGVRAHMLFCAVKIGFGVLSARRQGEWEKKEWCAVKRVYDHGFSY